MLFSAGCAGCRPVVFAVSARCRNCCVCYRFWDVEPAVFAVSAGCRASCVHSTCGKYRAGFQ